MEKRRTIFRPTVSDSKVANAVSQLKAALPTPAPNSCVMQLIDQVPFPKKPKISCSPPPVEVAQRGNRSTPSELLAEMAVSTDEMNEILKTTINQTPSTEWIDYRKGRNTASEIHRVYTRVASVNTDPSTSTSVLVQDIMGYMSVPRYTPMKHGLSVEPHAKVAYSKLMKRKHR